MTGADRGQPPPTTCSLRLPFGPSRKRPPEKDAAAFWATIMVITDGRAGDVVIRLIAGHPGGGAEHRPGVGRVALLDEPGPGSGRDLGEVEAAASARWMSRTRSVRRRPVAHHRAAKFGHAAGTHRYPAKSRIAATLLRAGPRRLTTSTAPASRSQLAKPPGEEGQGRDPGRLRRLHVPSRGRRPSAPSRRRVLVQRGLQVPDRSGLLGVGQASWRHRR